MMGILLKEQLKNQRGYAAGVVIVLTAAATLMAIGWSQTISEVHQAQSAAATSGTPLEYYGTAVDPDHYGPAAVTAHGPITDWGVPLTQTELADFLARANSEGAQAAAITTVHGLDAMMSGGSSFEDLLATGAWDGTTAAIAGEWPWDQALAEGAPPGPGQIALPAWAADARGLSLGDTVTWVSVDADATPESGALTVLGTRTLSGIMYDSPYNTAASLEYSGMAFVDSEDPVLRQGAVDAMRDDAGDQWIPLLTDVTWRNSTATTELTFPDSTPLGFGVGGPSVALWVFATLAVTALAIIMAVAVGRAQAQRRITWTATARALGATRGTVVTATLLEGVIFGAVAAGVGITLGTTATVANYLSRTSAWVAAPPIGLPIDATMVTVIAVGTAVLGCGMTAIPAALAARVEPAQALTGTPVVATPRRTRIPSWVSFAGLAVSFAVLLTMVTQQFEVNAAFSWAVIVAMTIFSLASLVEVSRIAVSAYARWLSRRPEPQAVYAGVELSGHPVQGSSLMAVQAVTMAVVAATTTITVLFGYEEVVAGLRLSDIGFAVPWMVLAQAVCFAIFAGARKLMSSADATLGALGATPATGALATVARFGVPQAMGVLLGSVVMVIASVALILAGPFADGLMDQSTLAAFTVMLTFDACVMSLLASGVVAAGTATQAWWSHRQTRHCGTSRALNLDSTEFSARTAPRVRTRSRVEESGR